MDIIIYQRNCVYTVLNIEKVYQYKGGGGELVEWVSLVLSLDFEIL